MVWWDLNQRPQVLESEVTTLHCVAQVAFHAQD